MRVCHGRPAETGPEGPPRSAAGRRCGCHRRGRRARRRAGRRPRGPGRAVSGLAAAAECKRCGECAGQRGEL